MPNSAVTMSGASSVNAVRPPALIRFPVNSTEASGTKVVTDPLNPPIDPSLDACLRA